MGEFRLLETDTARLEAICAFSLQICVRGSDVAPPRNSHIRRSGPIRKRDRR